jgi:hypothetical protein
MEHSERLWTRRLLWRLRGAWQWPAYGVLTFLDALILHELPPVTGGVDFIPALIVSSFGNLFLMGAVAPWLGRRLAARERPGDGNGVPVVVRAEVLKDRSAAVMLALATLGLLAAGLATEPLRVNETEDLERNAELFHAYLVQNAPAEIRRNEQTANTIRLEDGFFRTCVNYDDRSRAWCVFIDVDAEPPSIRRHSSTEPNQVFKPR